MNRSEDILRAAKAIGDIVADKNKEYGDSALVSGKILQLLYPDGVRPDQYVDMLLIVRVIDKLSRIAHEGKTEDPYLDLAGYGILGYVYKLGDT
jgi:hypothetical protein